LEAVDVHIDGNLCIDGWVFSSSSIWPLVTQQR